MRTDRNLAMPVAFATGLVFMTTGYVSAGEAREPPTLAELEARFGAARKSHKARQNGDDARQVASGASAVAADSPKQPVIGLERREETLAISRTDLDVPMVLVATAPPYPASMLRKGVEGEVMLRLLVDADGTIAKVELKESSGYGDFDKSAINSTLNW